MKKYFITETDEEVQFGDTVEVNLSKKTKHGVHHVEGEVKVSEMSLPLLLEMEILEEREVEEDTHLDFDYFDDDQLAEAFEELHEEMDVLCEKVEKMDELVNGTLKEISLTLKAILKNEEEKAKKEKPVQPKKK